MKRIRCQMPTGMTMCLRDAAIIMRSLDGYQKLTCVQHSRSKRAKLFGLYVVGKMEK